MCTPRRLWDPEHSRHMNAPIGKEPGGLPGGGTIKDAHRGCRSGQSQQLIFSGLFKRACSRRFKSFWEAILSQALR